jgi:aminomethyltransferase
LKVPLPEVLSPFALADCVELAPILSVGGEEIGIVTSGGPSPTLNQNIAMGYVPADYKKSGTEVQVQVRGKPRKAVVTKLPVVPTKYFK